VYNQNRTREIIVGETSKYIDHKNRKCDKNRTGEIIVCRAGNCIDADSGVPFRGCIGISELFKKVQT
jgi:hypothetical protein